MLVILTGLPATGKKTAKQFLHDMGYLSVDNVGIDIVQKTIEYRHLFDANKNKQVYVISLAEEADPLQICAFIKNIRMQISEVDVLYFEADEEIMYRRIITGQYNTEQSFSVSPSLMMLAERRQLALPIRAIADLVIDSGATSVAQIRLMLIERYSGDAFFQQNIVIEIITFSYSCGMIRDANLVLDLRCVEHCTPEAQAEYGREIFSNLIPLICSMLRQLEISGGTRFCIGLGCSSEKRLPLAFADDLKNRLQQCQLIATMIHRDLPPGT